jgi:hypothetical protein
MSNTTPKLVSRREVLHATTFSSGPRITEVQTIDTGHGLVKVDLWTQNGKLVKVGEPRVI